MEKSVLYPVAVMFFIHIRLLCFSLLIRCLMNVDRESQAWRYTTNSDDVWSHGGIISAVRTHGYYISYNGKRDDDAQ